MAARSPLPLRTLLAAVCLLASAGPVLAEKPKVRVAAARVGLPAADASAAPVAKFAVWVPVYVDLELLDAVTEPAELVIETPDADEVTTAFTLPLDLPAKAGVTVPARHNGRLPYLRPGAGTGETIITVRTAAGVPLSEPFRLRLRPRDTLTYAVLSLGGPLPGFELPKVGGDNATPLRNGRVVLATITDPADLPDRWVGYEAADLVVLTTGPGSEDFLRKLFGGSPEFDARRTALVEWVRRGGRLVISAGANAALVGQLPGLRELLPFSLDSASPGRPVNQLVLYWPNRETSQSTMSSGVLAAKGGASFTVANLRPRPDRPARVLIPPPARQSEDRDTVAVQSPLDLGRVTLVGFDLDRPPFTDFGQRAEFWDWVLREAGANRASLGPEGKNARPPSPGPTDDEDELAVALRGHLDTFTNVPVLSFGWVAVLIALYIVLIGPAEYLLLKRVFGRLELTWATFPVIVLTVAAAAYLTATGAKGRELRVNRVDVVDVLAGSAGDPGHVYGTTYFTVFSPRIDTFTAGVAPAEGWVADTNDPDAAVGWVGAPRSVRQGLARRRYEVHPDRLDRVPVPVWATKSFSANWAGRMDPRASAVASLEHPPGDPSRVIGTFTNRMPFEALTDCVVFYAGQAYPLLPGGVVLRGQPVRLVLDRGTPASQWLQNEGQLGAVLAKVPGFAERAGPGGKSAPPGAVLTTLPTLPLWGVLFHEASLRNEEGVVARNASLRRLDQSWRLAPDHRDEVILVGRVAPPEGRTDDVTAGPGSPARLRLKDGPNPLPGVLRQETFVRVYLPVRPAGAGR